MQSRLALYYGNNPKASSIGRLSFTTTLNTRGNLQNIDSTTRNITTRINSKRIRSRQNSLLASFQNQNQIRPSCLQLYCNTRLPNDLKFNGIWIRLISNYSSNIIPPSSFSPNQPFSSSALQEQIELETPHTHHEHTIPTTTTTGGSVSLSSLLSDDMEDDYDQHYTQSLHHHDEPITNFSSKSEHSKPPFDYSPKRQDMSLLLKLFHPDTPPKLQHDTDENQSNSLYALQLWNECQSQRETVHQYESILESARSRGDYTSLGPVRSLMTQWYSMLKDAIEQEQRSYLTNSRGKKDRVRYGAYLCSLQPEKMAVILAHIGITHTLSQGGHGAKLAQLAIVLGEAVEAEVNVQRLLRQKVQERALQRRTDSILNNINDNDVDNNNDDEFFSESMNSTSFIETVENTPDWMYGASHLARFVEEANRANPGQKTRLRIRSANERALRLLSDSANEPWTDMIKAKLGSALIQILLDHALLIDGTPAFAYEKKWVGWNQSVGHVTMEESFYEMIVEEKYDSLAPFSTRHKPMLTPPRKWISPSDGGYHALLVNIMRTHGCQAQKEALKQADLQCVYNGLNALGNVSWKINPFILDMAQQCWDQGVVLGDIPSRVDLDLLDEPIRPPQASKEVMEDKESEEYKRSVTRYVQYRQEMTKYRKTHQKNMDLRSLRCSLLLKLNQAEQFRSYDKIYFPYNLDFRGRAYPVPPHLSNVGSDLSRGLLVFSESKPLGKRGLYWLKVHIANLAGNDKISFDERAAFADDKIGLIRDSVEQPFTGERWWMTCDDPFQALAACHEVINAIDSGDPEQYECSLPVHMDGSCNGLQHYAALGRDRVGGTAVNLCSCDKPQDVYSGVMHEVIARVEEESQRTLDYGDDDYEDLSKGEKTALRNNKAAKLVNGLIDRGVVKRTVMTSVYGVTFIGAKQQIHEKIEEKLIEKGVDVDEIDKDIQAASSYLASLTMDVMGDLFQGARQTMNWLASCARLISAQGTPIAWISPIGLPIVQPYRQAKPYTIVTLVQHMVLSNNTDNLPIHKGRQVTAFPPNYVHSLDSSHMILTALEMEKRGLTFSAVHDSFWTHPCDIDELNVALRECFVELYDKPLLEELKQTWELRYPSINFPDLPKRGDLDLKEVIDAPYFFQ